MKTQQILRILPLTAALTIGLAACKGEAPVSADAAAPAATAPAAAADTQPAAAPITVESGTYVIDPTHTMVLAQWNHFGYSNPTANFGDAKGEIVIDGADMTKSSVNVVLPLSGLASFSKDFDAHLRNSDFFDAPKFPEARFASTSVESKGGNRYAVTGDLTIKDQTKPVTLDVTLNGAGPHPMSEAQTVGFDAVATIKRSDFGVGMFAPHVGDDVTLRITTEASQAAPAAAAEAQ